MIRGQMFQQIFGFRLKSQSYRPKVGVTGQKSELQLGRLPETELSGSVLLSWAPTRRGQVMVIIEDLQRWPLSHVWRLPRGNLEGC